ncbi:class I SAM-dependent RNA methyltransferase [Pseudoxanthobacter sp.]|uniref:class I SAM-dependent RNA methyltransferase n=1 Tax=Pseudoxanthobacter sp. TaxID=1925742 RepID=UPI002FDFB65C
MKAAAARSSARPVPARSGRRPAAPRDAAPPSAGEDGPATVERVEIDRVGHRGDGIAETGSGPVYVPGTLPGEVVDVVRHGERGQLAGLIVPSADRITPPCAHFGRCGGCALQHWAQSPYRAFKREQLVAALADRGLSPPVAPAIACGPGMRRRVVLSAARVDGAMRLGFHARASHDILDIEECPVAVPAIVAGLPVLKRLAGLLIGKRDPVRLTVTASAGGLDVAAVSTRPVDARLRERLVGEVLALGLARLAVGGEVILAPREAVVDIDGVGVLPPPGGFLQAGVTAEKAMAAVVAEGVGDARRVLDLFAGIGTFSLRLARTASVHAIDGERGAIEALEAARRRAGDRNPVTAEVRDLFRRPMQVKEFARYDAVVVDPPFAGARAQAEVLAGVKDVPRLVMVSCNPATLARDLAVLVAGGWEVEKVVPVDQFLWSPHVEAVAVLRRA